MKKAGFILLSIGLCLLSGNPSFAEQQEWRNLITEEFEFNFETLKSGARLSDHVFFTYRDSDNPSLQFKLMHDSRGRTKRSARDNSESYYNENVVFKILTEETKGKAREIVTVRGAKYNLTESAVKKIGSYRVKLNVQKKTIIEYRDNTQKSKTGKICCILKLATKIVVDRKQESYGRR
jgi:hypothetical protein